MKWTPGPWNVARDADVVRGGWFVSGGGYARADILGPYNEAEANAHLIAAAPCLYEALEEVLDSLGFLSSHDAELEGWGISEERGREIRAILAKARGEL